MIGGNVKNIWLIIIIFLSTAVFRPTLSFAQNPDNINFAPLAEDWGNCLDGDVWVLVDTSGSIHGYENVVQNAVKILARRILTSHRQSRVGVVNFYRQYGTFMNDNPMDVTEIKIELTQNLEAFDNYQFIADGSEHIGAALTYLLKYHQENHIDADRHFNRRIIFILISDGREIEYPERDSEGLTKREASQQQASILKAHGIDIFSVHILNGSHWSAWESAEHEQDLITHMQDLSGMHDNSHIPVYFPVTLEHLDIFFQQQFSCH